MKMEYQHLWHTFELVYDEQSRVLVLGTFPSVKSREHQFFYGHPQNRFWKVIAAITNDEVPVTIQEKKELLLSHHIAVWDVIQSCDIIGSSDSSIRNVVPSDINRILEQASIKKIYGNGAKACELYDRYLLPDVNEPIFRLPSTSPANAAWSLERLVGEWKVVYEQVLFAHP